MLNFHTELINNTLYNTLIDSMTDSWAERLSPHSKDLLLSGYYNAGVLSLRMFRFNKDNFYEDVLKENFEVCCDDLFAAIKDALALQLRRMFTGFNDSLDHYRLIVFFEGKDGDNIEPIKREIQVF